MSNNVLKVVEVLAESETSWEDAANQAIAKASRSVHGIKSLYIKDFEAKIEDNRITKYRINAKITFELD
ncbi:dodecin family protein [Guyparkeria sp. GHLCS8-2]|uniref:dodecin family protein n=1 Tax=Guyparkeria halopsychrophila TaxID=3139421 RepID=UPI0037CB4AC1